MGCQHLNFAAQAETIRLTATMGGPVVGYTVEIHIECAECHEPFEFIGLPMGSLPSEPACSVDGLEARMPIRPQSAPSRFGLDIPGFAIRIK